eukprot:TRINITY_DN46535_c0_g1_i1.p1 TRINITY_DN46535_c0_g1~~TRINITY_DN46535_c0_g1_i1.p1  ORF type:complete len:108 (+),score=32.81 TRINITY_DN46535_c0_g1_i1:32-355(+)
MIPHRLYLSCLPFILLILFTWADASQADDLALTLQYLEDLKQLYSPGAGPSNLWLSKKSGAEVGTLDRIGDSLAMRVRPRFGKRVPEQQFSSKVFDKYGRDWFGQKQ